MTYHNDRSTGEVIEGSIFTAAFVTHIHHSLFFPAQQRKAPPLVFLNLGKEKARKLNNCSRAEPWLSFCVNHNGCELWAQRSARPYDRSGSSAFVHSGNCSAENQEKCSACPLTPFIISYLSSWFIGTITHRSPSVNPFSKRNTNWYCQVCGNFILPDGCKPCLPLCPFPFTQFIVPYLPCRQEFFRCGTRCEWLLFPLITPADHLLMCSFPTNETRGQPFSG